MISAQSDSVLSQSKCLQHSLVLVTGASGHLGRGIALGLARDGAVPALNGRNRVGLEALAVELDLQGYSSVIVPADVGDRKVIIDALDRLADYAARNDLNFDGLVNNAFAGTSSDDHEDYAGLFAAASRINLGATADLTEHFANLPCNSPKSVVNVASIYGVVSPDPSLYPDEVPVNPLSYGVTKAGLLQLTRTMAVNLAKRGVRVNAVVPGPFPKDSIRQDNPEFVARLANRVPLGRLGEAIEIYPAIRFLLRRDSSFVTGASIPVDGGWTAI